MTGETVCAARLVDGKVTFGDHKFAANFTSDSFEVAVVSSNTL